MYGVTPSMLAKLYVKGSLQNTEEGFSYQIKNLIDSGSISGIDKLSVDGVEHSLEGITVQIGAKVRPISEITWAKSLYLSYGATLTVCVPGKLKAGEHTINMQANVPELGRISFPVKDTIE